MRCMHVLLAVLFVGLLCKGSWAFPRCCFRSYRPCNCPYFRRLFGPRNHGHGILTVGKRQRGEGDDEPLPDEGLDPSHGGIPATLVDLYRSKVDLNQRDSLPEVTLDHDLSERKNHNNEHSKVWDLLHHIRRLLNLTGETGVRSRRRRTDLQPYETTPRHLQISMRR